ncbi:response regulator [Parvularcula lutaonensis]|uniref:Response regulatory domain-containing protein n=1 Tax=Parvularcula lutaonensis TaxID=491923 RepID=A0ABV7M8Q5_9PROT|nr:hypothetical protein [Parvularcula lutaonensis]GGY45455.1 response regulator [Parvularcula lutaonensis]
MGASRILFLEDEIILALTFVDSLERLSIGEVHHATDIEEANAELDKRDFNIGVLDVNVAGVTSFGVAERMIAKGAKVIFATGYSFDPQLFEGFECEILRKPYEEKELRDVVLAAHRQLHGEPA